jgi:hypothetical protein
VLHDKRIGELRATRAWLDIWEVEGVRGCLFAISTGLFRWSVVRDPKDHFILIINESS